jgi:CheY-like chemotaxis protein
MSTKVLIVEDERIVAEDLRSKLESKGYDIIGICDSGKSAIEAAKSNRPDLILMDIRIHGELNGIETAIVIGSQYDHPIPIVFLTASYSKDFPVLKALDSYTYINKPFTDEELFKALKSSTNRSSTETS